MINADVQTQELEIGQISPSPFNKRRVLLGDVQDDLVPSVARHGVLNPIHVRKRAGGGYEIVAGERRWVAAKAAKLKTVPVRVIDVTDDDARELQLVENIQRKNLTPLEESAALLELRGDADKGELKSIGQIAALVAMPEIRVAKFMSLGELIDPLRAKLVDQTLALGVAFQIARMPRHVQEAVLEDYGRDIDSWTTRDAAGALARSVYRPLKIAPWKKDDADMGGLPACVACPKRSGAAPALFPEILADEDTCLDHNCYRIKERLHGEAMFRAAVAEHGADKVIPLSMQWGGAESLPTIDGQTAIKRYDWKETKSLKASGAKIGVIVAAYETAEVGKVLPVQLVAEAQQSALPADGKAKKAEKKPATPGEPVGKARKEMRIAAADVLATRARSAGAVGYPALLVVALALAVERLHGSNCADVLIASGIDSKPAKGCAGLFQSAARTRKLIDLFAGLAPKDLGAAAVIALTWDERRPQRDDVPALDYLAKAAGVTLSSFAPKAPEKVVKARKAKAPKAAAKTAAKPAAKKAAKAKR